MLVVALVPFKSHYYFLKIYFAADTATPKPEADLLDLISRNHDIMCVRVTPFFSVLKQWLKSIHIQTIIISSRIKSLCLLNTILLY